MSQSKTRGTAAIITFGIVSFVSTLGASASACSKLLFHFLVLRWPEGAAILAD